MSYATPDEAITAMCELQAEVSAHLKFAWAADCFCGELPDEWYAQWWENEGRSIDFIRQAVREKIEREAHALSTR